MGAGPAASALVEKDADDTSTHHRSSSSSVPSVVLLPAEESLFVVVRLLKIPSIGMLAAAPPVEQRGRELPNQLCCGDAGTTSLLGSPRLLVFLDLADAIHHRIEAARQVALHARLKVC